MVRLLSCGKRSRMHKKRLVLVHSDGLPVLLQLLYVASTFYDCLLAEVEGR